MDTSLLELNSDPYTLLNGMFATQLPPLLNNLITEHSSKELIKELRANPPKTLFDIDPSTKLINRLDPGIKSPEYIYGNNWAAESIKFFTVKINDSWRPMAIPNIKHSLMFTYNSLIIANSTLSKLYSTDERLNGKTSHSESPIIGRDGLFSSMLYEDDIVEEDIAIGFIGYDGTNKFFKESKLQRFKIESTYPYVLQMDLSKFFENIYTHLLSQISIIDSENSEKFKKFLHWLDEYNQKINDDHTKGIIQGPISSKISAELFQLSLDKKILRLIDKLNLDINFTRYVDDYRFFSKRNSDLELIKHHLIKLFRQYELSFNDSKFQIYKGFEIQKQAHLDRYPVIKTLTKGHISQFSFEDYTVLRETIINVLAESDIPTAKAILSMVKNQVKNKNVKFKDNKVVISLMLFLIKITYVKPILSMHIYKVISAAVSTAIPAVRHKIWSTLFAELDYIEDSFSDTDLEVWYFYALGKAGTSKETSKIFSAYKKKKKQTDLSVLVLTVLLKQHSKQTNKRIELEITSMANSSSNPDKYWAGISQSKWWLPISKLWIVNERSVSNNISKLFISNNRNKIQWDKLGIIEFLLRNTN
ncbi:RNA-directed DNA polymerase [Lactiplantibacillus plantarum]|uniref:RNA-directed DNA polymerase n=1 Tax=Lactiplantibacillus TaxID=2767842 RepID=UPI001C2677D3|nr:RNA-directed DNA polymerase [Lactiplantibacillus plantarum]MBU8890911.1 RNA-directed DNA polymerase [Lactiplantibacillus plantarum]MBW2758012.1 RNA-directed DNA polymerase [Lactiplantibacillus plantarum]MDG2545377.1 RNA-directed DNA polymerase [Lactiplantibacillus plantarum]